MPNLKEFYDSNKYPLFLTEVSLIDTDLLTFKNGYCYAYMADGKYYGYFAQVTDAYDYGNGIYEVNFEIYQADYDYVGFEKLYEPKSIWGEGTKSLAENMGEVRTATIGSINWNGKDTFYLINMQ